MYRDEVQRRVDTALQKLARETIAIFIDFDDILRI